MVDLSQIGLISVAPSSSPNRALSKTDVWPIGPRASVFHWDVSEAGTWHADRAKAGVHNLETSGQLRPREYWY